MGVDPLKEVVIAALEELKAVNIKVLDVTGIANFTDLMIIASGTSSRQVKALADKVVEKCKQAQHRPLGVEGEEEGRWVLVDLGDIVVHVMDPETRDFYNLEKLWAMAEQNSAAMR